MSQSKRRGLFSGSNCFDGDDCKKCEGKRVDHLKVDCNRPTATGKCECHVYYGLSASANRWICCGVCEEHRLKSLVVPNRNIQNGDGR